MLDNNPPQQTRQRQKSRKSHSKGKSPVGSKNDRLSGIADGHDSLLVPPVLQPPARKPPELKPKVEEESSLAVCLQVLFPYLLAGMGMVMAGMVLHYVKVSRLIWKKYTFFGITHLLMLIVFTYTVYWCFIIHLTLFCMVNIGVL